MTPCSSRTFPGQGYVSKQLQRLRGEPAEVAAPARGRSGTGSSGPARACPRRRSRSGGHADGHHVEPVVQVLAEPAVGDQLLQVLRSSPPARARSVRDRLVAADALELLLLEHAQHLRLGGRRHVADLVEEQRAAVACSNLPIRWRSAPVNAPFSWPNSSLSSSASGMAAQLIARNGRSARLRVLVDGAGDQFLAGAALAEDQHVHVLRGDAADRLAHLLHGRAAADDPVAGPPRPGRTAGTRISRAASNARPSTCAIGPGRAA